MRLILYLSFILLTAGEVTAQLPNDNLQAYTQAREGLIVLNNSQALLPLAQLDTIRPGLVSIGMANDSELFNTLNAYLPTARGNMEQEKISWEWDDHHQEKPNLLIIAINAESTEVSKFPFEQYFTSNNPSTILVIFGKSSSGEGINLSAANAPTVIFSQEDTPWAQSLAAQLIFGANGSHQRLFSASPSGVIEFRDSTITGNGRLAFAPPASLSINGQLLQDSIAAIVQDGLTAGAFPGAQVLVAKDGIVIYHQAFGYHTEQQERPVQLTDIYDLASVTKISSALAALMKWQGEGHFDLDAQLATYYPPARGSNKESLSFRTMLSHHARLRPWIPYWQGTLRGNGKYPWSKQRDPDRINDYHFRWRTLDRDSSARFPLYLASDLWQHRNYRNKMMKAILKSPLNEKAEYTYSGLLFYLLPDIVTTQTGTDYESYLNQTFYRPLGAYTLGFNPSRFFPKDRIIPTERDSFFRMHLLHGYVHDEGAAMMGGLSANAGLFSNAIDLAKMMQMYLNKGGYGGIQYISSAAIDTFNQRYYADEDNRRGLGFDKPLLTYDAQQSAVAEAASDNSFGHSGYTGTFTWMDPDNGLLFIFLSNRVYPSRSNRGIYTRNIRPRIHTVLYESLK
jgi:CubicO group peptidase (beta-lactamase class C family)